MGWGKDTNKDSIDKSITSLEDESVSTAQEAVPVPMLFGTQKIALNWVSPVYNQKAVKSPDQSGAKKSGGGGTQYDYYGTILGVIADGVLDSVSRIISDNEDTWPAVPVWAVGQNIQSGGSSTITQDVYRSTGSAIYKAKINHTTSAANMPPNTTYWEFVRYTQPMVGTSVPTWGPGQTITVVTTTYYRTDLRLYDGRAWLPLQPHVSNSTNGPWNPAYWQLYEKSRGSENIGSFDDANGNIILGWGTPHGSIPLPLQNNDWGAEHPWYSNTAYALLSNYKFGTGRTAVNNVEVVVARRPLQTVVTGNPASLYDGQANAAAIIAELWTSPNGLGMPATGDDSPDATSFQATADTLYANEKLCGVSLIIDEQTTLASILSQLALTSDIWARYDFATRRLKLGVWTHGVVPTSYTDLTFDDLAEKPKFQPKGWGNAKSLCYVTFNDRAKTYKGSSAPGYADMRIAAVLGRAAPVYVTRNTISRRAQAAAHATEFIRAHCQPTAMSGTITVRREKGRAIHPGDWLRLPVQLEPAGAQVLQFFRVVERSIPYHGAIKFSVEADETLSPMAELQADNGQVDEGVDPVPAIAHARIIEAPGLLAQDNPSVIALIERPSDVVTGYQVWYDPATDGDFTMIGKGNGFAVRATLRSDIAADDATIPLTVHAQSDLEWIAEQPGATGAGNDSLLCVLVKTAAGQVANDANGYSYIEVASISAQDLAAGDDAYDLTVLRGRQGTLAQAFSKTDTEVWIIHRNSIANFTHRDFDNLRMSDASAFIRLLPFTPRSVLPLVDAESIEFDFPSHGPHVPVLALTAPATASPLAAGPAYPVSIEFSGTWSDPDGDLTCCRVLRYKQGEEPKEIFAESFAGCSSKSFTTQAAIDSSGTWFVVLEAYDAPGHGTRVTYQINAAVGTAKPAKPEASHLGVLRLSPTVDDSSPTSDTAGHSCYGWLAITCQTVGATIKRKFRVWDSNSNSWGAWSSISAISGGGMWLTQHVDWELCIWAEKDGALSDFALYTFTA